LWPGWDHDKTPVAFHDAEKVVLFGHPDPGPQFRLHHSEGSKYHVAQPKPACFTANTAVDVAGIMTATIMWQELNQEQMLGLITHEAFHAYQMMKGCPFGQIALAMQYPVNNALVQALAETEATLLATALSTGDETFVRGALDARAGRQQQLPRNIARFEDEVELGEGLATYIEVQTAGSNSSLWPAKVEALNKLNRNAWGSDRLRFYYSGMAWALLADRYASGWQQREWEPVAAIVAEALGHAPDHRRRQFPGLVFKEILSRQEQEAQLRQEEMQRTLALALPGTGLRVEVSTLGNPVGGGWNPMTAVTYPGVGRFHPTGLMYIYDTGTNFKVEKNCIEEEPCRRMVFERPQLDILADGQKYSQGTLISHIQLRGEDVSLDFPQASISRAGNIVTITEL
jgi:hypothetical protein